MDKKTIMENIQSFVEKAGYFPLDLKLAIRNETLRVSFAIYKQFQGVSLDDCSKVTLIVRDFLNMLLGKDADFIVDVSSPGAERRIRRFAEFDVFSGKKVRVVLNNEQVFLGVILGTEKPDIVKLRVDEKDVSVQYAEIANCRLMLN